MCGSPAVTRTAAPEKRVSPQLISCAGFCWDGFGEWKVCVVKGKMSQAFLRDVFIAKAFPGRWVS